MKYCFIINPNAGKGGFADELRARIAEACERKNVRYDVFVSQNVDATMEYVTRIMAEEAEEVKFFACGGDGTLCKTVWAVMRLPSAERKRASVGVVPVGTGNDFVSNFENKALFTDIDAQIESEPHAIDLLRCNDAYSVNMINIGFDCHVVCKKEEIGKRKWLPKKFAYIFSLIITLIRKPGVKMNVSTDGAEKVSKSLLLTTFANGAFCGGGFCSNPKAALDDGKIDFIEIKNIGRMKFVSLVGDYKKGNHIDKEKFKKIVTHGKCSEVKMSFDDDTPVSVDGEIIRTRELHLSIDSSALSFLIPKGVVAKVRRIAQAATAQAVL